jgi:HSP20 family molecular chaperone IbpA
MVRPHGAWREGEIAGAHGGTVRSMSTEQPSHREVVDATAEAEATMRPQRVPVNVYEASGALVVVGPMPAVTPDDVNIELRSDGRELRIWARLRSAGPRDYLVHEWEYGGYERELEIPEGYGAGIEATLTNGQLAIRVLKGEPAGELKVKPTAASAR